MKLMFSNKKTKICLLVLSLLFLNSAIKANAVKNDLLTWNINVGDTKKYSIAKINYIYEESPFDGGILKNATEFMNNPNFTEEDFVDIVYKKGMIIQVTVKKKVSLRPPTARLEIVYGNIMTEYYQLGPFYVRPTIDSRDFWAEYCQNDEYSSISGDLIIITYQHERDDGGVINMQKITKWNWKTGWLTSYYDKHYNETHILQEYELKLAQSLVFGPSLILVIATLSLSVYYCKKRRS